MFYLYYKPRYCPFLSLTLKLPRPVTTTLLLWIFLCFYLFNPTYCPSSASPCMHWEPLPGNCQAECLSGQGGGGEGCPVPDPDGAPPRPRCLTADGSGGNAAERDEDCAASRWASYLIICFCLFIIFLMFVLASHILLHTQSPGLLCSSSWSPFHVYF